MGCWHCKKKRFSVKRKERIILYSAVGAQYRYLGRRLVVQNIVSTQRLSHMRQYRSFLSNEGEENCG